MLMASGGQRLTGKRPGGQRQPGHFFILTYQATGLIQKNVEWGLPHHHKVIKICAMPNYIHAKDM